MSTENEKRKRAINFSEDEKMKFLRILQKYGQVIITNVNLHDLQSNSSKEDTWSNVADIYNFTENVGSIIRTTDSFKKLWQKMKTEVKSFNQTNGTRVGPLKKMDNPVLELVAKLNGYGSSADGSPSSGKDPVDCGSEVLCTKDVKVEENSNLKRRWPTVSDNEQSNPETPISPKSSDDNSLKCKRGKYEMEQCPLTDLHSQQWIEVHGLKMKEVNLRIKILESVLKKINDEKPVNSALLKIVSYM